MLTKDFLAAVLPSQEQDFYCGVELKIVKKIVEGVEKEDLIPREHAFVHTLEELADKVTLYDDRGYESYFAVSTFATGASRSSSNGARIRSLFADIDVGAKKRYKSIPEALERLSQWVSDNVFPLPFVVVSGYGIHCYWPFVSSVSLVEWKPVAEQFKRLCTATGLSIDLSVSADASRVLRVPNTKNRKRNGSKNVRVLLEGETKPFSHYSELLANWKEEKPPLVEVSPYLSDFLATAPAYATTGASYKTELQEVSQGNFDKIVELGENGCLQINNYIQNAAADGAEPLFRSVISIAKFCVDGDAKAYELGRLHPYADDRIGRKLAGIKGPHNCATFNTSQPGICEGCKHWGKIHNPIALGRELKSTVVEIVHKPVQNNDSGANTTGPVVTKMADAPEGYQFSERGVTFEYTSPEGIVKFSTVADTPFYAKATYDRAGERFVQFSYVEHKEEKMAVVPMSIATSREESIKAFAKIGIMVPNAMEAGFRTYMKATIAQAKKSPPLIMPTNLGWQADDSFAFNSRIYTKTGDYDVPLYGFENISETIGVRGTLDGWRLVVAGVMRLERWDIVAMMAISLGAPLMRFTGLNGLTFHLCGNDSGKGKTLCQRLASSVWGVPDKFRTTPNTSPVAMINRLGMLGNLPLMVDEITHRGRADAEWFPEFLSQMSDGRGKDRMESQTNTERRNTTTWSTLALMTSNKHMMDYLTAERSHGSEGEVRRLVEITFDKDLNMDELTRSLLFDTLPENYGVAGEAYARWMVRNVETVKKVVKNTYAELFDRFEATGDERFWIAGCACILAGVRLAGKNYADIINIPVGKIAAYLYEVIKYMRVETGRMKRSAVDVLNEFTKRNFGKLVTVNGAVARISGIEVAEVLDRRDLCGRVEKVHTGAWIDYYIEEKEMRAFCSSLSYGYSEFKRDLGNVHKVKFVKKNLLHGTKGPSMSVQCIHVTLPADVGENMFAKKAANG